MWEEEVLTTGAAGLNQLAVDDAGVEVDEDCTHQLNDDSGRINPSAPTVIHFAEFVCGGCLQTVAAAQRTDWCQPVESYWSADHEDPARVHCPS